MHLKGGCPEDYSNARLALGVPQLFYFVWGNCLVAFGFMLSTMFTNAKPATIFAYLWVVAGGLLGNLLFEVRRLAFACLFCASFKLLLMLSCCLYVSLSVG